MKGIVRSSIILIVCFVFCAFAIPQPSSAAPKSKQKAATAKSGKAKSSSTSRGGNDEESQSTAAEAMPAGCKASYLMDAKTGDVIEEKDGHTPRPPASMVKLMVAYVTLKEVQKGNIKLDDMVQVSAHSSKIGGSQVYLKQGEEFSLGDLLKALLIQSANDAAMTIAERIGGTSEGFVDIMNKEAKELGMNESEFHSPHGLPPGKGQLPDLVSPHDMALLGSRLLEEFPHVVQLTSLEEADFRGGEFKMSNHNHLLKHFPGCDGLKTGYYNQAGFCITATAKRNDSRVIAVVMGCSRRPERDGETSKLLARGLSSFSSVKVVSKGTVLGSQVPVESGMKPSVDVVAGGDLSASLRSGAEAKIVRKLELCPQLKAPVEQGMPCGVVRFLIGGKEIGQVAAVVSEAVPQGGASAKIKNLIGW